MTSRIRNTTPGTSPQVRGTTTPARTARTSTPEAPASNQPAGWTPGAARPRPMAAAMANAIRNAGPSSFEMVPGRYRDAVPLPTVLQGIAGSPQGQAALNQVLDQLQAKAGVTVSPDVRAAVLSNPAALTKAMELTPAQLSHGILALNGAYQAGKLKAPEAPTQLLPRQFDLSKLDEVSAPRPPSTMKELAPGLFQGDLPSAASDQQVLRNRVLAETFGRLANNPSLPPGERFSVTHGGKEFTSLEAFAKQLQADGYEVQVTFEQRIANFSNLKTVVPGSNPPQFLDVPAPLMVKTGIKDALGREAVVPAVHSEMIVSIKAGPNAKGPKFDADLKFYQGTSGTGFFPCNVHAEPSWCGRVNHATVTGADALKAITVAGAFTDVVTTTAKAKNLYADGYGVTGVCNDSVAVVQQAVTGKATQYPLLMRDEVLYGALKERLSDADKADDPAYKAIRKAMRELPSDIRSNGSQKERALLSLPWAPGREPFVSSEEARRILSE
jgi:hypothetical protein